MPELPEAETIVRGLRPALRGRTIVRTRVVHADVLPQGARWFREAVRGRTVRTVERRGKNVVLVLDEGRVVLVNLGMTGKLLPDPPVTGERSPTHPAVRFGLEDGGTLVYDDVRRFGRVEALSATEWTGRSRAMGSEPLDPAFGPRELGSRLGRTTSPIRSALLDQKRVAGIGNIYANEALFRAAIHPLRPAGSLDARELDDLHRAIRAVLTSAIDAGGTTIRDYRNAFGEAGRYSRRLRVYDREGEECPRCGTAIRRIVFGNRSAFVCPRCQKTPET